MHAVSSEHLPSILATFLCSNALCFDITGSGDGWGLVRGFRVGTGAERIGIRVRVFSKGPRGNPPLEHRGLEHRNVAGIKISAQKSVGVLIQ